MPGGVAAKPVTEHDKFGTKYPRVLPQTCRGASDVYAQTHTHTFLHTQIHQEAAQSSLQTWHAAKNRARGMPGNACTQKHKHTHTCAGPEVLLICRFFLFCLFVHFKELF